MVHLTSFKTHLSTHRVDGAVADRRTTVEHVSTIVAGICEQAALALSTAFIVLTGEVFGVRNYLFISSCVG